VRSNAKIGLLFLLLGCSAETSSSTVTFTDSSGVLIVESSAPQWDSTSFWEVAESPILDLSRTGSGPQHEFYRVRDALKLPDGGIVVANYGSSEVRFFDSSGHFVKSVGREGEGPGEFQRIDKVSLMPGDSVAVADYWLRRITILSQEGELGRVISLEGTADRVRHLLSLGDSGFVGLSYSYASMPDEPGNYRMPYEVLRLGLDGTVLDTVAVIGGFEGAQGAGGDAAVPWGKDGHLAVHGTELVLGSADELEVDWYEAGGALMRRFRVPALDLRISEAEVDSVRRAFREAELPPSLRQILDRMEIPERRPAYSDLLIDTEGYTWAAGYYGRTVGEKPVGWEVFAPGGEWLGTVHTPGRFTAFEIGMDYVLGVFTDELDIERVQLLDLRRH